MKSRLGYILAGILILLLYFLPNLIWGDGSFIQVHDFLDSNVAHIQSMKLNGGLFASEGDLPILCGIDRATVGSPWNLRVLIYALLPTFWAIIANLALIKLTAFLGLFFLLADYVLKERGSLGAAFVAAILFALVPFYPDYGISSAGIPMLVLAFAWLQEGRRILPAALLIAYYAFFSSLVLSGFFACVVLALLILIKWLSQKRFPWLPFLGLFLLAACYVALNWQLLGAFLTPTGTAGLSHRTEFAPASFWETLGVSLGAFLIGQYHAGTCLALLPLVLFFVLARDNAKYASLRNVTVFFLLVMLSGALLNTVVLRLDLLNGFQCDRFYFLYPALVFTLLGVVLHELRSKSVRLVVALVMLVFSLAFDVHLRNNLAKQLGLLDTPSFAQYYDTALMDRMKDELDLEGKKVACLGLHPAIPEYNGIYTVDGYYSSYPLSYKHRFQQVIQGELDKSPELKSYFCGWGSRCYLFSSELGLNFLWGKDWGVHVHELSIDTGALKALGCDYILSALPVDNAAALGLQACGSFTEEDSFWQIWAYRL